MITWATVLGAITMGLVADHIDLITADDRSTSSNGGGGVLLVLTMLIIYLLPMIVAYCRGHYRIMAIVVLNLLLGWTLLGWVAALIWACNSNCRASSYEVGRTSLLSTP